MDISIYGFGDFVDFGENFFVVSENDEDIFVNGFIVGRIDEWFGDFRLVYVKVVM